MTGENPENIVVQFFRAVTNELKDFFDWLDNELKDLGDWLEEFNKETEIKLKWRTYELNKESLTFKNRVESLNEILASYEEYIRKSDTGVVDGVPTPNELQRLIDENNAKRNVIVAEYSKTDNLVFKASVRDDHSEGETKEWFTNGLLRSRLIFQNKACIFYQESDKSGVVRVTFKNTPSSNLNELVVNHIDGKKAVEIRSSHSNKLLSGILYNKNEVKVASIYPLRKIGDMGATFFWNENGLTLPDIKYKNGKISLLSKIIFLIRLFIKNPYSKVKNSGNLDILSHLDLGNYEDSVKRMLENKSRIISKTKFLLTHKRYLKDKTERDTEKHTPSGII